MVQRVNYSIEIISFFYEVTSELRKKMIIGHFFSMIPFLLRPLLETGLLITLITIEKPCI